jgi:hypothetical protein
MSKDVRLSSLYNVRLGCSTLRSWLSWTFSSGDLPQRQNKSTPQLRCYSVCLCYRRELLPTLDWDTA